MVDKKIVASFIIEILGRPPEYVKETLIGLIDKIDKEKGTSVVEKRIHEPRKVDEGNDLYTTFAEVEAEFDTIENMLAVAFAYMPSNFEVISPAELNLKNVEVSNILTSVLLRLHKYEEIVKKVGMDNAALQKNLKEIVEHLKRKKEMEAGINLDKSIETTSLTEPSEKKASKKPIKKSVKKKRK